MQEKTGTASGNRHCFAETVCAIYDKTMDTHTAQCYVVQFCQYLSFTKKDTIALVKEAYSDAVPPDVTVWQW